MGALKIPKEGIALLGGPCSVPAKTDAPQLKPLQAMRLELEEGILENILRSARSGGKGVHLSFGKTITLDYGNRSKQLSATVQDTPTELYGYTEEKDSEFTFSALQTHRLAMKKAHEDTMGADVALAKLQNQLAAVEREKQARQIQLAPNSIDLSSATKRGVHKSSAMRKNNIPPRRPVATVHSAVSSPSLHPARSPHTLSTATSEPPVEDAKAQKSRALRIPLIHFLAVRPVSEKYLGQTLGCDQKDCLEVLQRVGKPYRLDPTKWDLNDKAFKELDVWQFNYPTADDRQLAIDRAISSYDRLRLPGSHLLWQKLLPAHERGKGKVLSNLKLSEPMAPRGTTPRINVQQTDTSAGVGKTPSQDNDTRADRLAPNDAEPVSRSKPSHSLKEGKANEKIARAATKELKKPAQTTKRKEKVQDKPTTSKKGVKKGVTTSVLPKSSEFVHDSDEDDDEEMMDVSMAKSKPSTPQLTASVARKSPFREIKQAEKAKSFKPSTKRKGQNGPEPKDHKPSTSTPVAGASKRPPTSSSTSSSTKKGSSDSSQTSLPMSKTLSRQRTTSSPHKPSPLGSSPPTNASELENESRPFSSTSSTPLLCQARPPVNHPKSGTTAPTNGSNHVQPAVSKALKRKAPDHEDNFNSRDRGAPPTNGTSLPNGHSMNTKRYKASPLSPPPSESSTDSSVDSRRRQALEEAQRFKQFWARYQALYAEVSTLPKDVPNKKVDDLKIMHERLTVMKADISRAALL